MQRDFVQLLVIGGGSGGLATARRAAQYGAKVALVEAGALGGTCVNVGCVPKKVMFNTASVVETLREAQWYGLAGLPIFRDGAAPVAASLDYAWLKRERDAYIARLNGIYATNLQKDKVAVFSGLARFVAGAKTTHAGARAVVAVANGGSEREIEAETVVIATGSSATVPSNVDGAATLGETSDGFFAMGSLPKRAAVVGSGYIAVELAGVMRQLGVDVTLYIRHGHVLRAFDPLIQESVTSEYERQGIRIVRHAHVRAVRQGSKGRQVAFAVDGDATEHVHGDFERVFFAIGRHARLAELALPAEIKLDESGFVRVDQWQETAVPHILALGDVTGHHMLTPVAIAAGRRLADRLYGGRADSRLDYTDVPSVIFSHPPCGSVGLSEPDARRRHGDANVRVYTSSFNNMYYCFMPAAEKCPTRYKLVCAGPDERVVGVHLFGRSSDEILQGFAVAVRMGATKADFDRTVAIHPTAAEELVTMR